MNKENTHHVKERVQVYVDGFNLYFGMLEAGYDYCKWLNLKLLATNLLKPNQELVCVKYFTSRVSNNPDKQKRQATYIEALESEGVHNLIRSLPEKRHRMQPLWLQLGLLQRENDRCQYCYADAHRSLSGRVRYGHADFRR